MLQGIDVELNCDFYEKYRDFKSVANKLVFTGMIDEFFDYCFGELEYRSLRFEKEYFEDIDNYQGVAAVNYTGHDEPFTRIIEHKHFEFGQQKGTIITKEYSNAWRKGDPAYYPINDERNSKLYLKYKALADEQADVIFGGRLGTYQHLDMDQIVSLSLQLVNDELKNRERYKHAFLIMAHNNWDQLKLLLRCLDDKRSNIYVHIDKKSKDFDENFFNGTVKQSKLVFIERKPVFWGTETEIETELRLLENALVDGFDYCHLLSGQDFPIKSMDEIDLFMDKNDGKNFLEFNPDWYDYNPNCGPMGSAYYKANYYHPFIKNNYYRKYKIVKYADHLVAHTQMWLHIKRTNKKLYSGSQFFL